jgi:tellurite resistance protein TehA-like permease
MVFPLGMYRVATFKLAGVIDTPFLLVVPHIFIWPALIVWTAVFIGLPRTIVRSLR